MSDPASASVRPDEGPGESTVHEEKEAIAAARARLLYANLPVSQAVAIGIGVVLAIVAGTVVDRGRVAAWLACLIAVTLARWALAWRYSRAAPSDRDMVRWCAWFCAGAGASGLVWGATAVLLYPAMSIPHQTFIAFALGGMVAGAMTVLTPVYGAFALFSLFALVPVIVRFAMEGNPIHYAMAAMGIVFLLAMLAIGRRIHDTIDQSLRLGLENRGLITRLTEEKTQVESVNEHLLAVQEELRKSNERLESRVRERTAALEDLDRRKDEFLAMLSHELRNPLAPIRNSIYILGKVDPAGPEARHAREVLERQTRQITRLVDDLLDLTRIARGKIELRREAVDFADLVARTAEDHRSIFRRLGVGLDVDVPQGSIEAHVDRVRMAQVIGNLLQNAAKFTPAGGRAKVTLRAAAGEAELRVRDTGRGIPADFLPVLFEPFAQINSGPARTGGGLGLGLTLVKEIVEMHGGTVRAESEGADKGSLFVVRVPLHGAESPSGEADPSAGKDPVARRVLVVDDNRDAADSLAQLVRMFGHAVEVAYGAAGAMEIIRDRPPEVVLCDLGLPGMSGYELARMVRAEGRALSLIAVSGYAQPSDVAIASEAGFNAHVAKPPSPETIRRLLA